MLSEQQGKAVKAAIEWYKQPIQSRSPIFRIFGFAGTGKSFTARHIEQELGITASYMAFTGKAALVMRNNGCHGASTIHSQIYKPVFVKGKDGKAGKRTFVLNTQSPVALADLIILDECSMVGTKIARDLLSFGVPILVLGDPFQLPPIDGTGFFTQADPDCMLTKIHRQAKDSPVIYMATAVRQGKTLKVGKYGSSEVTNKISVNDLTQFDTNIVGRHATRVKINKRVRRSLDYDDDYPMSGEKVICLKNDSGLGIYNGTMLTVDSRHEYHVPGFHRYDMVSDNDENELIETIVHDAFFDDSSMPDWRALEGTQHMDFGYCITGHKSQGSQWPSVLIFDESFCFRESADRWLYTTITRAEDKVKVYRS